MENYLMEIDQFLSFWQTLHVISAIGILIFLAFFIRESIKNDF